MTNKLLLEAGFTRFMFRGGTTGRVRAGRHLRSDLGDRAVHGDQSGDRPAVCAAGELRLSRRSPTANPNYANPNNWRASASYVTGSHEMKVGYQGAYIRVNNWFLVPESQLSYRFNQGVPNQFTFRLPEWHQSDRTSTAALYIQDKWTRGRLTLQGALRYDRAWSFSPAEHNGTDADVDVQRGADQLPADARRRRVQRHHAALRRRLRRVRQRQDGAEVQSRPLPRRRDERQRVHEQQSGRPHRSHGLPELAGHEQQQGHRLRHHELRRRTASAPR